MLYKKETYCTFLFFLALAKRKDTLDKITRHSSCFILGRNEN